MKVREFATVVSGATPASKTPEYYDGNIVWFTPKDLSDQMTKYVSHGERTITVEGFQSCSTKMLPAGSVLMSSRAPIGLLAITTVECCTNQGFKSFDVDASKCNPEYLYYYLKYHIREVEALGSGTTFKEVSKESIEEYDVQLPELDTQNKIVKVLSDIDSKISLNNSICADLEAMAKLLYDYWFIQFDFPDENGKPYKSSGGKMVWNEELKREIPEGWEVKTIGDCIASNKNGDWGNEQPNASDDIEVRCFRGADFPSITNDYHTTAPIRYISNKNRDRLLSAGDLVTEISGGSPSQSTGRIGYISQKFLDRSNGVMDCSNFCKAFTPIKPCYQYWLYQTWKSYYDVGAMFNYESKTTGIKNLMFDEFVESIFVAVPNEGWLKKYNDIASMLYDKIQDSFIESEQLSSLRDFLLPMLMNRQVKVGGAAGA